MTLEALLIFLLIGAIAGWLAGFMVQGGGFGVLGNILVGIVGAIFGGVIFSMIGLVWYGMLGAILVATLGAILFLYLIRLVKHA